MIAEIQIDFMRLSSQLDPSLTQDPSRLTVRVGEYNLHKPEEFQVDHEVEQIFIYPSTASKQKNVSFTTIPFSSQSNLTNLINQRRVTTYCNP